MAKKVPLTKLIKYADRFMGNGTKSCTASDFLARFDRLEDSARDVFRTDQVMQMLNSTKSDDENAKFVVPCFFQLVEFYTKGVIGADVKGDGNATAVAKATGGSATGGDAKSGDNKTDVRVGGPTRGGRTASMVVSSGDVVVLGGASRQSYHGVDRIYPGTSTLLPETHFPEGGRINLTLRRVTIPDRQPCT